MKQIIDYEIHQHLTFLYLAFAHQTDFDFSDEEYNYIVKKIVDWVPDWEKVYAIDDFQDAVRWYSDTCNISKEAFEEEAKKTFLDQFGTLLEKGKVEWEFMDPVMTTVMAIAKHLGQTLTEENGWNVDTKTQIISELNELAKVDGHVCDNEKEWLIGLANDMGL